MTQQYSRWQDLQNQPGLTRAGTIEELRLRIHQFVIDKLGSKLSDDASTPMSCAASCRNKCTSR